MMPDELTSREQILVEALRDCVRNCNYCDTTALRALVNAGVADEEEEQQLLQESIT